MHVAWGQVSRPPFPVPDFLLIDHNGQSVSRRELLGHVWVADFIMLQRGVSSAMATQRLSALARHVPNADVRFVSFSIDPGDSPPALERYRKALGAADWRWRFLVADQVSFPEIAEVMGITASPFDVPARLILVDPEGMVRASFDAFDDTQLGQLAGLLQTLNPPSAGP